MKVRITGVPKQKQSPDVRMNPFSSPYADQMKYGGPLTSDEANGNRRLDTKWDWMRDTSPEYGYSQGPYVLGSKTLPKAKNGTGNINAEKQEQVMGDFNGDGMPVLMNVNGPTHTEGGKDINVPNGSFVFSDTKNLQIKDQDILKSFGMSKAATPAQIAKKYDLQKYKAILDNKDADEIDKKTAELMYTNYVNKLNELASVQESMKQQKGLAKPNEGQQGASMPQQPAITQYGGPQMFTVGGNTAEDDNTPEQIAAVKEASANKQYSNKYDPKVLALQKQQMTEHPDWVQEALDKYGKPAAGRYDEGIGGPRTDYVGQYIQQKQDQGAVLPNYMSVNYPPYIVPQQDQYQFPLPYTSEQIAALPTGPGYPQQLPQSPMSTIANPYAPGTGSDEGDDKTPHKRANWANKLLQNAGNPDAMRQYYQGLKAMGYVSGMPVRQIAQGATPQGVQLDNRALLQHLYGLGNADQRSASGPIERANEAARMGEVADKAAVDTGQMQEKQAMLDWQRNQAASAEYNRLQGLQQGYNKDYRTDVINELRNREGFNAANMNEDLKRRYEDEARKRDYAWQNKLNPYYGFDARGFPVNRTAAQQAAIMNLSGQPGGGTGKEAYAAQYVKDIADAKLAGVQPDQMNDYLKHIHGERIRKQMGPYGLTKGSSISEYADTPHAKFGGPVAKKIKVRISGVPK